MARSASSDNLTGAGLALFAFALYATHDVVVKYLGHYYTPFQTVFFSTLLGFPLVALVLIGDKTDGNLRPRRPGWSALRTASVTVTAVAAFYAFARLPMAQVYAILFATPLLITLLAIPLLGERVGLRRGVAVVVGLVGVLIVLRPGQVQLGLGHLAALSAACTGALGAVIVRKIGSEERTAVLLLYPMLANFACMGAIQPWVYREMPFWHFVGFGLISALGMVAMLCTISAYRRAEAVIVAPMQYSQILWAALYGYFLFDERPDAMTALGAAVIIVSGIYIVLRESRLGFTRAPVLRTRGRHETGTLPRMSLIASKKDGPDQAV